MDEALRPPILTSMDGRTVSVLNPGRWNLEAGPDFLDAIIRIGPEECIVRGDIELHIRPLDWRHHKHTGDPRYRNIVAHVTYFEGLLSPPDLPASVLQIPLRTSLLLNPAFSFDGLDLLAYPFASISKLPPCADILKSWTPDQQGNLLDAAGEERLRLKSERMKTVITERGKHQILYEEFMGALGYKHNRLPFLQLAQTIPLERLRQSAESSPLQAYAILLGVGGLLPQQSNPLWDLETRTFVRSIWDIWWKHQTEWFEKGMSRDAWRVCNLRPANNPLRRLMAAAYIFTHYPANLAPVLESAKPPDILSRTIMACLESEGAQSYWAWRGSFSKPRHARAEALIGAGRIAAIFNNVLIPWWAATNAIQVDSLLLNTLPQEDSNRFIKHTAHALFGHDHSPTLYHSGLRQQGLLQIFHDFCLSSKNGCAGCPLPSALNLHQK
jgi:hypothetical protein